MTIECFLFNDSKKEMMNPLECFIIFQSIDKRKIISLITEFLGFSVVSLNSLIDHELTVCLPCIIFAIRRT